ncbi:MAG: hypothetical protein JW812_00630, partial [Alphaproteobacteria bacterium]|nr:hypothetical protein [Alphaproteobacteria bacterium]
TQKMMFSETPEDPYWMNAQKERIDSPLALLNGVRKSFTDMCKKAFKNHIPFEIKAGVLFTAPLHDQLPALKEKYPHLDLFSLEGDKLPLLDTVLSGEFDPPSDEFIEFATSVAHYFDKTYEIIKADPSELDEED